MKETKGESTKTPRLQIQLNLPLKRKRKVR